MTANDVGHDLTHAQRVAADARVIGVDLNYDDLDFLELCGWWHDVGRIYNPDHEKLSAKLMCQDLKRRGVAHKTRRLAHKAVYKHRWDMEPKTIEGRIIKDADKLDFISVERWNMRQVAGDQVRNQKNLDRLPYIRSHFYFDISRRLFDQRLGAFAENLAQNRTVERTYLVLETV